MDDTDLLFKGLADPNRRKLLDLLRASDGRTLGELCEHLDMTRQAATQHLGVLEAANLVAVTWRGREKLHFLNPVPLQEVYERWLRKFDKPRLEALHALKIALEGKDTMQETTFVYVTYIRTTPSKLWAALTSPEFSQKYWFGVAVQSEWKAGSAWQLNFADGRVADTGEIVEIDPPKRLVIKWRNEFRPELKAEGYSFCRMELEAREDGAVKLTITHSIDRAESKLIEAVSGGWPLIMSNLKSLLETGEVAMANKAGA